MESQLADISTRISALHEQEFLVSCYRLGLHSARLVRTPKDYYDQPLSWRRGFLGADAENHLLKSMVVENNCLPADAPEEMQKLRYLMVVLPYTARMNSAALNRYVRTNMMSKGLKKQEVMYNLASNGTELTGYLHNAVTPIGSRTKMPLIIDAEIHGLPEDSIVFLGAGEIDLKLALRRSDLSKLADHICGFTNVSAEDVSEAS